MVRQVLDSLRTAAWWRLLLAATVCGIIVGAVAAIVGVPATLAIATHFNGQQGTELGDAVLAIYAFATFSVTGFIAGISITYGLARRRGYTALVITCIVLGINIAGFFVPTGGYALAPFYASILIGLVLTIVFLILRSAPAKS